MGRSVHDAGEEGKSAYAFVIRLYSNSFNDSRVETPKKETAYGWFIFVKV